MGDTRSSSDGLRLLTRQQVAERLNCSQQVVYNLHRVGRLRGKRLGKELRWLSSDVETFLRAFAEGER